ncbi:MULTISPECIES: hypothetical protein [unclassified Brevundimonas]|uniref:hypothetical protein n=1 Tax=unclassified Brevundimonas TaxID=2622653 RepID=UPI003F927C06
MTHEDPHSHSADAVEHHAPIEAQYVRQGRSGVRILWLLILSGGAAAVLLLGMWLLSNGGFQTVNPDAGGTREDSAAFSRPHASTPPAGPAPAPTTAPAAPQP